MAPMAYSLLTTYSWCRQTLHITQLPSLCALGYAIYSVPLVLFSGKMFTFKSHLVTGGV